MTRIKGRGLNKILRSDKTVFLFKEILALWDDPATTNTRASNEIATITPADNNKSTDGITSNTTSNAKTVSATASAPENAPANARTKTASAPANLAKAKINYYVKTGQMYPLRKGIYAKDKNYNKFELACKIFKPSYISLETVLSQEGLIAGQNKSLETVLSREGLIAGHNKDTPAVLSQEDLIPGQNKHISSITYQTRTLLCDRQAYEFKKIKNSVLTNSAGIIQKNNYAIASKERALLDALYLNKNYHFVNLNSVDWEKCFDMAEIYENKSLGKRLYDIYESFKYK